MLNLFLAQLLPPLVQLFGSAVGLIVSYYLARILAGIQAKVTNQRAADALTLVTRQVTALVLAAADEVRNLKAPDKPGEWTATIARSIRDRVVTDALRSAPGAVAELRRILGLDEAGLRRLLTQLTEAQVESLRREAAIGAALVAPVLPAGEPSKVPAPIPPRDAAQRGRASFSLLVLLVIVAALAAVGAVLAGCPQLPLRVGCAEGTQRCDGDRPAVCSATGRWHQAGDLDCAAVGGACTERGGRAFCAPRVNDAGTTPDGGEVR